MTTLMDMYAKDELAMFQQYRDGTGRIYEFVENTGEGTLLLKDHDSGNVRTLDTVRDRKAMSKLMFHSSGRMLR